MKYSVEYKNESVCKTNDLKIAETVARLDQFDTSVKVVEIRSKRVVLAFTPDGAQIV